MTTPAVTAGDTTPVIGTMDAEQYEQAQAETRRILANRRTHRRGRRRAAKRLSPYCACCGCITRYCICSCCCQK